MNCRYCGTRMNYIGIQDGGGDYGDSVCDEYQCMACDWIEEDCGSSDSIAELFDDTNFEQGRADGLMYFFENEDLDDLPGEET